MKVNADQAKKLFDKGYISKSTYNKLCAKYADGGAVTSPNSQLPSNPIEQIIGPAVGANQSISPELQQKIEAAKQNTVEQAQNVQPQREPASFLDKIQTLDTALANPQGQPPAASPQVNVNVEPQPNTQNAAPTKPSLEQQGLVKVQPGQNYDPLAQLQKSREAMAKGYDKAFGMSLAGINAEAQAGAEAAAKTASAYTTAANDLQEFQQKQNVLEEQRKQRLDEQNQIFQQKVDDYAKSATIDPNRYWADKSTGQKIMSGIAIALGGIGRGGGNDALQLIQNAISRDIDAQKSQLASKAGAIQMQNNIYSNMLNQFQDERSAATAARLAMVNLADMKIKQVAAAAQGPMAKAQALKLSGDLMQQKAQLMGQLAQSVQNSVPMMMADETNRKIMFGVPKEQQGEAYKELAEYQKHHAGQEVINKALNTMWDNRTRATPSQRDQYDAAKAVMLSNTSELFGGKSEQEFERMTEGFASGRFGSKDAFEKNKELLMDKYASQKSYPILQGQNIIPRKLNLKRNE